MAYTEFYTDFANGSNSNGGSDPGSPSFTDPIGVWDGTSVITTAVSTAGIVVGQFCNVNNGAYIARVIGVGATTITLSTTAKSGTSPGAGIYNCNVGGAFKGPNGASGFPLNFITSTATDVAADYVRVNLKNNAVYSITANINHGGSGQNSITYQGMTATPGDGGRAIIDGGTAGASYTPLSVGGLQCTFTDLILRNNGATSTASGVSQSNGSTTLFIRVSVLNMVGTCWNIGGYCTLLDCEAFNSSGSAGFSASSAPGVTFINCLSYNNAGAGFAVGYNTGSNNVILRDCIAANNGSHGLTTTSTRTLLFLDGFVAYNNTGDGVHYANPASTGSLLITNSLFVSNTVNGITATVATNYTYLFNNAFYGNVAQTSGVNALTIIGSITLTGNPFTDATHGDFSLNSTAGTGSACRNAGLGTFTETTAVNGNVTNATNATPIQITTQYGHGLSTGMSVTIASAGGNTNANGTWVITKIDGLNFTLNTSVGNANYTSGGTWTANPYFTKTTTSHPDVGAVQHLDSGGGSSVHGGRVIDISSMRSLQINNRS